MHLVNLPDLKLACEPVVIHCSRRCCVCQHLKNKTLHGPQGMREVSAEGYYVGFCFRQLRDDVRANGLMMVAVNQG